MQGPGGGSVHLAGCSSEPLVLEAKLSIPGEKGTLQSKVVTAKLQDGPAATFLSAAFALSIERCFPQRPGWQK